MKKIPFFNGLSRFANLLKLRKNKINNADSAIKEDHVSQEAMRLHPGPIGAKLVSRIEEAPMAYRLRFEIEETPFFKPGQFVSLRFRIGDSLLTRPYSIVSSPGQAKEGKAFDIIVQDKPGGFAAAYLCHDLPINSVVQADLGHGRLTFEPIRDGSYIVALVGGSGITPWLSYAHWLHENPELPYRLLLLHGSMDQAHVIGDAEILGLNDPRIRLVPVISDDPNYQGEKGFIDKALIRRYVSENERPVYFICGPVAMENTLREVLGNMGVDQRKIHCESFSTIDVPDRPDFPQELRGKVFQLRVIQGKKETIIPCRGEETIAAALERTGLYVRTCCRTGECGGCKVRVLNGEVFVYAKTDNRRYADAESGYVFSCVSYPKSDVTIRLPIPPKLD